MTTVREGPELVWLRVGDVASALGVSANTVRRWTDVGRLAAYRSPGGHRRYLAEDVMALLPQDEGEGAAQPGDFAALRRETQDLRAVVQAGLSLMSLMVEDPQAVAGETVRALCALTGAPHGDVYLVDGDRLRLVVSANDGDLDPGRQGAVWATDEWIPVAGDSGVRRRHLHRGVRWAARAARETGAPASRLPLAGVGAHGAQRRARRRDRAQRRGRSRLLAPRGGPRWAGRHLRRSRRRPAHLRRAGTPRQDRARARRPVARGGADARLRALRVALRGADPDRRERRLRRRVPCRRRRDPVGHQLYARGRRSQPARHRPRHLALPVPRAHSAGPHPGGAQRPGRRAPRRRRGGAHARMGVRELAHDAARRRRQARRPSDPLRRRRARLERRAGVPHQRLPARRRRLRQHMRSWKRPKTDPGTAAS